MKIRYGFVSNSSSSSFCIVNLTNQKIVNQILDKLEFIRGEEHLNYGEWSEKEGKPPTSLSIYGNFNQPQYIGLEAVKPITEGNSLPEMKRKLQRIILEEFGIIATTNQMEFSYGEVSSE